MWLEEVDDAVDALGGVQRVHGREHEVAGLGGRQGGPHRLLVTHLADQDHVGVLTQDAAHGTAEGFGVHPDLALVDDRLAVAMQILDRILDRHDVPGLVLVDPVDDRRQRRRLAGARGAGEQNQAALLFGDLFDRLRQPELLNRPHREGDHTGHDRNRAALAERVDAEARQVGHRVGEVDLVVGVERRHLLGVAGEHLAQHSLRVGRRQRVRVLLERLELAAEPRHRSRRHLHVKVRALVVDDVLERLMEIEHP